MLYHDLQLPNVILKLYAVRLQLRVQHLFMAEVGFVQDVCALDVIGLLEFIDQHLLEDVAFIILFMHFLVGFKLVFQLGVDTGLIIIIVQYFLGDPLDILDRVLARLQEVP